MVYKSGGMIVIFTDSGTAILDQLLPGCVGVPSRGRSPSSTADRCCNTAAFLVHLNLWVIGHIMIILEGRHRDVGICIFQAGF